MPWSPYEVMKTYIERWLRSGTAGGCSVLCDHGIHGDDFDHGIDGKSLATGSPRTTAL